MTRGVADHLRPVWSSRIVLVAAEPTANQGSLWRCDDGGAKWKVVSWDRRLIGRAGYYIRVEVNPQNDLEVIVANSSLHRSLDGGETFPITGGGCGDCHDIWMDRNNPAHWAVTGDAGAGWTRNHGQSYTTFTLPSRIRNAVGRLQCPGVTRSA